MKKRMLEFKPWLFFFFASLLILASLVMIASFSCGRGSKEITPETAASTSLWGVAFLGDQTGMAAGSNGTILRTEDGGSTWARQESGITEDLYCVSAMSTATWGAVAGENGIILKTRNGGSTWSRIGTGETSENLYSIYSHSTWNVACGGQGTYLTSPNGNRWDHRATRTEQVLYDQQEYNGAAYAVGASGTIIKSTDLANTWTAEASGTNQTLYNLIALSSTEVWAVGAGGTILKTSDGKNWATQESGTSQTLYSVDSSHDNVAEATILAVGANGTIIRTTDAGSSWSTRESGTTANLHAIWFVGDFAWVVGANRTILKSIDGGLTWKTQSF